jgi:hypothetical protein
MSPTTSLNSSVLRLASKVSIYNNGSELSRRTSGISALSLPSLIAVLGADGDLFFLRLVADARRVNHISSFGDFFAGVSMHFARVSSMLPRVITRGVGSSVTIASTSFSTGSGVVEDSTPLYFPQRHSLG